MYEERLSGYPSSFRSYIPLAVFNKVLSWTEDLWIPEKFFKYEIDSSLNDRMSGSVYNGWWREDGNSWFFFNNLLLWHVYIWGILRMTWKGLLRELNATHFPKGVSSWVWSPETVFKSISNNSVFHFLVKATFLGVYIDNNWQLSKIFLFILVFFFYFKS